MPIISFATSKGGAGKTTAAIVLATQLAKSGRTVTVIDCDPEKWASKWGIKAEKGDWMPKGLNITSRPDDDEETMSAIEKAQAASQYVLLDLEGTSNALIPMAITQSDLVVIPMQASSMDSSAALKVIRFVMRQNKQRRVPIAMGVLFNRTSAAIRPKMLTRLHTALKSAAESDPSLCVFKVELVDRSAFKDMIERGAPLESLASDVKGKAKAVANGESFAGEVLSIIAAHQKGGAVGLPPVALQATPVNEAHTLPNAA